MILLRFLCVPCRCDVSPPCDVDHNKDGEAFQDHASPADQIVDFFLSPIGSFQNDPMSTLDVARKSAQYLNI